MTIRNPIAIGLVFCLIVVVLVGQWLFRPVPLATLNVGSSIRTLVFSPHGQIIIGSEEDVQVWDTATYQHRTTLIDAIGPAAYTSSHDFIAAEKTTTDQDTSHVIGIWDARTGTLVDQLVGHTDTLTALAFSPDGSVLASASVDHTIRTWRMSDMRQLYALNRQAPPATALSFSPDSQTLATSGTDLTIRLWNVRDRSQQRTLNSEIDVSNSLAWSPDGHTLAAVVSRTASRSGIHATVISFIKSQNFLIG